MTNSEMKEFWSGDVGTRWVALSDFLDAGFARVTAAILSNAQSLDGARVLDVGCGAGALSRAMARRAHHVLGLDISSTMLTAARARSPANATYVEADAQSATIPDTPFDAVISQFGMMFFDNTVAALSNIRSACRSGGELTFATWARVEDNPWFRIPRELAVAATGPLDTDPDAPGPMRMRDIATVNTWLRNAGWQRVEGTRLEIDLPLPGTLEEVAFMSTRVGGASAVLAHYDADKSVRQEVTDQIARAFADHTRSGAVHVPATINIFTARA